MIRRLLAPPSRARRLRVRHRRGPAAAGPDPACPRSRPAASDPVHHRHARLHGVRRASAEVPGGPWCTATSRWTRATRRSPAPSSWCTAPGGTPTTTTAPPWPGPSWRARSRPRSSSPRAWRRMPAGCRDSLAQNEISWNCDTWRSGGPSVSHPAVTSFDFLDEILRKLARRDVFPNLRGSSSPGTRPAARSRTATGCRARSTMRSACRCSTWWRTRPATPGPPTSGPPAPPPGPSRRERRGSSPRWSPTRRRSGRLRDGRGCTLYDQWPYGFKNRTGYSASISDSQLTRQLVSRPFTYLLGEDDILPLSGFDSSCEAMAQGPTRQARGQAYAKYVNERLGGHHRWSS